MAGPPDIVHAPRPGAEGLSEPMRSRWSTSVYDDQHTLTRDEIDRLLHAAQWAPSAGNSQPWVFFVCERGSGGRRAEATRAGCRGRRWCS